MTKFEEELNKIEVEVQTPIDKYIVEKAASDESLYAQHYEAVLEKFKDWHPDEDYQRAKRMVERMQFENELLKNKLKQQALPVVPEDIAKFINTKLDKSKNLQDLYDEPLFHTGENYLTDDEYDFIHWFNENTTLFEKAWTNGYTVEKPQLFYLKAKELLVVGDYDHVEDLWLDWNKNFTPKKQDAHKFTQQEIDSMNAGSYEQIKVEE